MIGISHSPFFFAKLCYVFFILIASGCASSPIVHLYLSPQNPNLSDSLTNALVDNGLQVETPSSDIPSIDPGNYIVYYPDTNTDKVIEDLNLIIRQYGLDDAQPIPFGLGGGFGSHEYTRGNIGLYLIKGEQNKSQPNSKPDAFPNMHFTEQDFGSKNCSKLFILEFHEESKLYIVEESNQKKFGEGKWRVDQSELTIKRLFKSYNYKIVEHTLMINGTKLAVTDLIPVQNYKSPFGCAFSTYYQEGIYRLPKN
jgi:hypothetical protein